MDSRLIEFLDRKVTEYNKPSFIEPDPISIPHRFSKKQDIEIAGFFAAIFAWGNRKMIINKCLELLRRMDGAPYDFILNHQEQDLQKLVGFKHRTFNDTDLLFMVYFLHQHYTHNNSLETAFTKWIIDKERAVEQALTGLHTYMFSLEEAPARTRKHIATPYKNSTCKRLNMFLRWMVRKDNGGVDLGLWNTLSPSDLICPVDLHVARVARRFDLIKRKQTDWFTALELTQNLRKFDPADPVKYDYALFGLGVIEKF